MKCVHPFGTGRHKRQADITLLFQYISYCTLILLDIHITYVYKATITLSMQKYVYITKHNLLKV